MIKILVALFVLSFGYAAYQDNLHRNSEHALMEQAMEQYKIANRYYQHAKLQEARIMNKCIQRALQENKQPQHFCTVDAMYRRAAARDF